MLLETMSSTRPVIGILMGLLLPLIILFAQRKLHSQSQAPPYPPGPTSPIMPTRNAWVKYQEWGEEYGDVVYIRERGILILNSLKATVDLLEKRASVYSDRLVSEMIKLSGLSLNWGLAPYSEDWRKRRKLFHQHFRADAVRQFYPAQYERVHHFLRDLITTSADFQQHTMSLSQGIVFSAVYGLSFSVQHRLSQIAVSVMHTTGLVLTPGLFVMVELFPWLRHLPLWFPVAKFHRVAERCRAELREMSTVPFEMAMQSQQAGTGSSFIADLAAQYEGKPEEIELVKSIGIVSYLAAADTTMASVSSFLLTMTLYPDIQAKGQDEIDRVVGQDRLPTLDDRRSLPYIEGIYREVMRLMPPGVPHKSMEDDNYRGFHIPKGTNVIPNIWAMNRDETLYEEPCEFRPERYLYTPKDPFGSINEISTFGFGRRVCPGRYMADASVWITIASVLATLNLKKARDANGHEVDIDEDSYTDQFFLHPKPYQCSITPRSKQAEMLIRGSVDD